MLILVGVPGHAVMSLCTFIQLFDCTDYQCVMQMMLCLWYWTDKMSQS